MSKIIQQTDGHAWYGLEPEMEKDSSINKQRG